MSENGLLPPGVHTATWTVVTQAFGNSEHRGRLLAGLRLAAINLRAAGCLTLYLDGSFVTEKRIPDDYDACWDPAGVNLDLLDPVLKKFGDGRVAQKAKYGGEFFPSTAPADPSGKTFLDFFQEDRDGTAKGVVVIDLRSLVP